MAPMLRLPLFFGVLAALAASTPATSKSSASAKEAAAKSNASAPAKEASAPAKEAGAKSRHASAPAKEAGSKSHHASAPAKKAWAPAKEEAAAKSKFSAPAKKVAAKSNVSAPAQKALVSVAEAQYNPDMTRAFAALSTLAYCTARPPRRVTGGLAAAVERNCGKSGGSFCKAAGLHVVPGSVRTVNLPDLNQSRSLFAIVAQWQRTNQTKWTKHVPHKEGCLVVFRGSVGNYPKGANWVRAGQSVLINTTEWPDCYKCKAVKGYYTVWQMFQPAVVARLRTLGCTAEAKSAVYLTGHSMGGAVASMGMYGLKTLGFNVQVSYTFSAPKIGNAFFTSGFGRIMSRAVPQFRVNHGMDRAPLSPFHHWVKAVPYEIWYRGSSAKDFVICHDPVDHLCGLNKFNTSLLQHATAPPARSPHCRFPEAPYGNFCQFTGSDWGFYLGAPGMMTFNKVCKGGGLMSFAPAAEERAPPPLLV